MSGELDLSLLLRTVRHRWWVVLLFTAAALLAGAAFGLAQDRPYEAVNSLLVHAPRYIWRMTGEIVTVTEQNRDYQREILAIARNDEVAAAAVQALQTTGGPVADAQTLKRAVAVRAGDGNTLVITASSPHEQQAVAYAKAWTQALMDTARTTYGVAQDLQAFEAELAELDARVLVADQALTEARARTGLYATSGLPDESVLSSPTLQTLSRLTTTLADYRVAQQSVQWLQQSLAAAAPDADVQQMPWELLDTPVFSRRGLTATAMSVTAQEAPEAARIALAAEAEALSAVITGLEVQVQQAQSSLAAQWQEIETLTRERTLVRELQQEVYSKVNELRIEDRVDPSLLTVVGSNEPQVTHVRAPLLGLLVTSAVIGLVLGSLLALWSEARRPAVRPR
ncbi:MAG: Wzz/FepE/Etk N-terminal domain-containing protein [Caldilineales bacterium]|mgnify:CR=1 FL=1